MNKILVTRPFFPPQEEYALYLNKIWKNQWLTNMGPLALELEEKLKDFIDIKNLIFVSNGTIALHMAIRALGLKGERSEEHTSELQSRPHLVCRLLLEKKKQFMHD